MINPYFIHNLIISHGHRIKIENRIHFIMQLQTIQYYFLLNKPVLIEPSLELQSMLYTLYLIRIMQIGSRDLSKS